MLCAFLLIEIKKYDYLNFTLRSDKRWPRLIFFHSEILMNKINLVFHEMISRSFTMLELRTELLILLICCSLSVRALMSRSQVLTNSDVEFDKFAYNEDADLTPIQLMNKYGYHGETHHVTTEDGYLLEMHRIVGQKGNLKPEGKQPILLMHGLLSSSIDWIITGPEKAFGYILADEGYDVWMGNMRGNTFSRKHNKYSTIDKEYWQFSWHENGYHDLPAMIDYILEKTMRKKLIYLGHSQGTTCFWVMNSERPEYQDKVEAMFALGPVAYLTHIRSPIYQVLAEFGDNFEKIMSLLGWWEFKPTSELVNAAISLACDDEAWTQKFCTNIIFLVAGYGSDQLNTTMLTAILGHIPAGASVKQIVHYAQLITAQKFQQYDHGLIKNLKKYGHPKPPIYDLSGIKVPVYLHYASNDWFSDTKDVQRLYKELGNPIGKFRVPYDKFGHIDFLWAKDAKKLFYDKIISLMRKYKY